jgi:hypothetical protein
VRTSADEYDYHFTDNGWTDRKPKSKDYDRHGDCEKENNNPLRDSFPATQGNPSGEILTNSGFSYKKSGARNNNTNSSSEYNFLTDEEILANKNTELNSTIMGYQNEIRYLKVTNENLNGIITRLNAERSFVFERCQESPHTCGNIASIHRAIITEVKSTNF